MEKFNELIKMAIHKRCSDIFILPFNDKFRILLCINGKKKIYKKVTKEEGQRLIGYLKYRGNMTVSEHRRPQTGAIQWISENGNVDLRLSSVGNYQGQESLVVRFIYPLKIINYNILIKEQWKRIRELTKQRGLILFAGPMGSGKTTTMYRLLRREAEQKVVMTIEDPVEIEEPNFIQLQVNEQAKMGYQELLRVGLRHRPDTFIIGEIRDSQTAQMAVQAALSGHLVLATVHAKNARGAVTRLKQLGIENYYLYQVLTGICYQRLLPTIDGPGVLFEILEGQTLENCIGSQGKRGISDEWQKQLRDLFSTQQISAETINTYKNG